MSRVVCYIDNMDCVFCRVAKGEIPAKIIRREGGLLAIRDIAPKAKTHVLIFPAKHLAKSVDESDCDKLLDRVFKLIREIAREEGIDKTGYRVTTNHGANAGQSVNHIHFHLLGGEPLKDL